MFRNGWHLFSPTSNTHGEGFIYSAQGPHSDPHQLVPSKVEPGYVSGKSKSYIEYLLSNVFLTTPLTL